MSTPLSNRTVRAVYLVTYSQANLNKFPEREDFSEAVATAFNTVGDSGVKVLYHATCREKHQDGNSHYHCTIKLSGPKRWLRIKNHLSEMFGIVVNFTGDHDNYYSAYKYITKEDPDVYHSTGHPNLKEAVSPKTKHCLKAWRKRKSTNESSEPSSSCTSNHSETPTKSAKITALSLSKFLVENNIKTRKDLFAIAKKQQRDGKEDLYSFCLTSPILDRIIDNTWELEEAPEIVESNNVPRMDVIKNNALGNCAGDCDGLWLKCAKEVLNQNDVCVKEFSKAMRKLIQEGRGKHRNILVIGPSNCAKTFLFKPLRQMFKTFSNPGNDKYAFMNAADAEIIFLNDFRWSKEVIPWRDLLLLLEGEPVHIPTPRNHFRHDVCIEKDTPIIATSISKITYQGSYQARSSAEDEMMDSRWKTFSFSKKIPEEKQIKMQPCPKCFSDLILAS